MKPKLKGPKPLRRFDIFPDGGWIHFRCYIWKTKNDMYQALPAPHNFAAISCGGEIYKEIKNRLVFSGCIGELHFFDKQCRTSIITHELCHACHRYFRFRRWFQPLVFKKQTNRRWVNEKEEMFCWIIANLVREFMVRLHKQSGNLKNFPLWFERVKFRRYSHPLNWDGKEKSLTRRKR